MNGFSDMFISFEGQEFMSVTRYGARLGIAVKEVQIDHTVGLASFLMMMSASIRKACNTLLSFSDIEHKSLIRS